jgi:hypothetical protein
VNWKTVWQLVRVDMKSTRLLRGQRLIHYNISRNRFFSYLTYGGAIAIGLIIGIIVSLFYNSAKTDLVFRTLFNMGFTSFSLSLPTIIVVITLVFTLLQQLQRSGASSLNQAPYWLPVTWQEHTLATIFADVMGLPLLAVLIVSPAVIAVSIVLGQIPLAIGATFAMLVAAFMGCATTEVFRILQARFTGAVYKSSGKAAIWVRFASTLLFFLVFYIVYFYVIYGTGITNAIQSIATVQSTVWFVPFVWLGITLASIMDGLVIQALVFMALSLAFVVGLYLLSVALNTRFGLYEPPAITVSRGVYVPKTGILGKLGFSSVEAALIRKDVKAFTRRRELMAAFILPIVFLLIPIMSTIGSSQGTGQSGLPPQFGFAFSTLLPTALIAMTFGNFMTGEEGQNIWRIYSSPISEKNFIRSKYSFMLFFALLVLPMTSVVGLIIYHPSLRTALTMILEAVFVAFAAGALSLDNGIRGADFNEVPRPRMIRAEWSLINMVCCMAVALAVVAPLLPYVISMLTGGTFPVLLEVYPALAVSGIIAVVLTVIFYSSALSSAKSLLIKAEA